MIGLNTAIIPGAQGICFAIGVDTVKWVVGELLAHRKVRRGYLGFGGATLPLSRRAARYFDVENLGCIRVESVERGSPAERVGVKAGDVVLRFDGKVVNGIDDLHRLLSRDSIGRKISLVAATPYRDFTIEPVGWRGAKSNLCVNPSQAVGHHLHDLQREVRLLCHHEEESVLGDDGQLARGPRDSARYAASGRSAPSDGSPGPPSITPLDRG